jgi:hypothetical protein
MKSIDFQKQRLPLCRIGAYLAWCILPATICAEAKESDNNPAAVATDYPSLQAAIDANPGGTIIIPPGDHKISESLEIRADGTVLEGTGHIVQVDSNRRIVHIDHAKHVVVRDVTLARPADADDSSTPGLLAEDSEHVRISGIRVIENHSMSAAISLRGSSYGEVENCTIVNYRRVGVDDRTKSDLYGYAFRCIDGTGIDSNEGVGVRILNNQIIERRLISTPDTKEKYHLGDLVDGKYPTKFGLLGRGIEQRKSTNNWHQGAAVHVSSPEKTSFTRICGNYMENCAQGIDIHSDNFICSDNIVNHGMMGMKAMHGSRNGIISRNLFSHVDNWGIMLGPGAASHAAEPATDGKPGRPANTDGSIIISNNVISDFGQGWEFWNWGGTSEDAATSGAILIERGQIPSNPPLSNILIEGNIVSAVDEQLGPDGKPFQPKPRYHYALVVHRPPKSDDGYKYPQNIVVRDNLFAPGRDGITNLPTDTQ